MTTPASEKQEHVDLLDTSKMSKGQREAMEMAEAGRETTWNYPTFSGKLFMGHLPWDLVFPFPKMNPEDKARGEAFLDQLEAYLRENVNPDQIDREGEIPDPVIADLGKMGAFGIKVPQQYGGLGLSQVNYCKAATVLGSYDGSLSALISAHQSIGIPQPLLLFGTEEQKRTYLPRVAKGEISAFALTEDNAGSDPAQMSTTAEPTPDGKHYIINGEKLWCTNSTRAGLIIVMARTPDVVVKGKPRKQVTAFIVEMNSPGVKILHRCRFMGLKALYNGVIEFKDVKVPAENIVWGEGRGLKVALTTLNTGRLTIPGVTVGAAKACLRMVRKWANEREQWGQAIGKHAAIADKIAKMTATTFAMEAMTLLSAGLADGKKTDIRLEAAMAKAWCTEMLWKIVDETMQIRGGRGYETADSLRARGEDPMPIERLMRDVRINLIFEGSSEIMRLLIAREAMDPHLRMAAKAIDSRAPMGERASTAAKAGMFYAPWYVRNLLPISSGGRNGMMPALQGHARFAEATARSLSRALFHQMLKFGPKLDREQMVLKRLVDIGMEVFAITATLSYAQHVIENEKRDAKSVLTMVDYFVAESKERVRENFRGLSHNNDRQGYKLSKTMLEGDLAWLEEGIVASE